VPMVLFASSAIGNLHPATLFCMINHPSVSLLGFWFFCIGQCYNLSTTIKTSRRILICSSISWTRPDLRMTRSILNCVKSMDMMWWKVFESPLPCCAKREIWGWNRSEETSRQGKRERRWSHTAISRLIGRFDFSEVILWQILETRGSRRWKSTNERNRWHPSMFPLERSRGTCTFGVSHIPLYVQWSECQF
jgi:hypothetical protein